MGVQGEGTTGVHLVGSVLHEECEHARTAGSSGHPEDERVCLAVSRLELPLEEVALAVVDIDLSRFILYFFRSLV